MSDAPQFRYLFRAYRRGLPARGLMPPGITVRVIAEHEVQARRKVEQILAEFNNPERVLKLEHVEEISS